MKKLTRWIIILVALLVVLLGIGLAAALNSGLQTSIVLNILHKSDPAAKLGRVAFGFSSGDISGLEMTAGGAQVKLGSAKLQYSLGNLLFGATKVIESADVKDLVIDLTAPKPAAGGAGGAGATGEKKPLPAVLVKKADIAGSVILAASRTIDLSLTAQNVGAGGDGTATGTLIYHDATPGTQVSQLRTSVQATVALDGAMFPKNVDCTANLTAALPGQAQSSQLSAHLVAKPVNAKTGDLALTLAPPGGAALVDFKGTYTTDGDVSGDFNANVTRAQIEPFAFGLKLPDFNLHGQGQFTADATQREGSVKAALSGTVGQLQVARPELAGMGTLAVDTKLDLAVAQPNAADKTFSVSAKALSLTLAPQGGQTAVALDLLKPVAFQIGPTGLKLPAGAGADLLRLTLSQAPAAWLTAALPKDFAATGQGLNGQILISALDNGALVVNTAVPVTFAGLDVQRGGQPMLAGGSLSLDASAQYLNKAVQAQVRNFSFAAHTAAAGGITLTSVALTGQTVQGSFTGNVALVPGGTIPQILANGQCNVALDFDRLDQKALGHSLPTVAPGGLLKLNAMVDIATAVSAADAKDISVNVNSLQITLTKGDGAMQTTFATLVSSQKFNLPLGPDAKLQAVNGNLAMLDIADLPLSIAQALLPPRFKFSGNPLHGKLQLAGGGGTEPSIVLQTTEPLTIQNAQFSEDQTDKLAGVTLTLAPEAGWTEGAIKGGAHLQVVSPAGTLLDAMVEATQAKDTQTATVTATGQLAAIAAQPVGLEWRSYLPATKPQFSLSVNVTRTPQAVTIQSAEANVAPAGGAALAEIKVGQAFTLPTDPADGKKFLWPKVKGNVLTVKLSSLPAGVLALAVPGYRLQGREISADLEVTGAGDGNYSLVSNAPVTAAGLSVAKLPPNAPPAQWVRDLTFTFKPSATFSSAGVSAGAVQDLLLSSGNTPLASGNVNFVFAPNQKLPGQAKISARADLAELLRQPVLARFDNLESGQFQAEGALAPDGTVQLNASLQNWKVRGADTQLPQMTFDQATGKLNPATGEVQINVPVKGQGSEGPTDCVLAATYGPSGNSHKFSLNVSGNNLVIDDLMAVKAGLFPPAPAAEPAPGTAPTIPAATTAQSNPVPDTVPIWGDLQGAAQIQLRSLRFHAFAVENFAASAQVSPTQAVLPAVTGMFGGAPLTLNATLDFDQKQSNSPYSLKTAMSFKNFDAGAYFLSRDAKATPPVEGNFSITGNAGGQGANINDVIDKIQFDFQLGSDGGTFHLLDMIPNKKLAGVLKGVSTLASAANALIGLLGKSSTTVDNKKAIASSILSLLGGLDEFKYTKLAFNAQRGPDLTMKLSQFDVQGAEIELLGTGQVTYVRGVAIPDQPLKATLSLNAKGGMAQGLQTIHLLGAAQPNGYSQGPQFQVAGTLQHPDYGFLYNLLTSGAAALGLK